MKKAIYSMFAAGLVLASASCSSDDGGTNNGTITAQALSNTVTNGTWRVTAFSEDGIDQTALFTGYNFTFNDNSTVSATNGENTYSGVWTITDDEDDDDSNPNSDFDFNLSFTAPDAFTELTEDWDPIERNGNLVRLRHISGGDGSTDYLTFERNTN